jgi:hypothetical protein
MKLKRSVRAAAPAPALFNPITLLTRVCFALGGLIVVYWLIHTIWPLRLPRPVLPDPATLAAHVTVTPSPNPTIVAAITERPLFQPDRQPLPGDEPAGNSGMPVNTDSFNDARLVGIAGDADGGIAIISHGEASSRVRQGEQFEGWTLEALEDRSARFVSASGVRELHLMYEPGQPPAAAPGFSGMPAGNMPPSFSGEAPGAQPPLTEAQRLEQQSLEEAIMAARRAQLEPAQGLPSGGLPSGMPPGAGSAPGIPPQNQEQDMDESLQEAIMAARRARQEALAPPGEPGQ